MSEQLHGLVVPVACWAVSMAVSALLVRWLWRDHVRMKEEIDAEQR